MYRWVMEMNNYIEVNMEMRLEGICRVCKRRLTERRKTEERAEILSHQENKRL